MQKRLVSSSPPPIRYAIDSPKITRFAIAALCVCSFAFHPTAQFAVSLTIIRTLGLLLEAGYRFVG